MPDRSEYQPISQTVDDDEADVAEPVPSSSAHRPRSSSISKKIDLGKLDNAFKRCVSRIIFRVYSDRWSQMDRVYCSKDEDEEEAKDGRLERSQGDL